MAHPFDNEDWDSILVADMPLCTDSAIKYYGLAHHAPSPTEYITLHGSNPADTLKVNGKVI